MPSVPLNVGDAIELAEILQFLSDWTWGSSSRRWRPEPGPERRLAAARPGRLSSAQPTDRHGSMGL